MITFEVLLAGDIHRKIHRDDPAKQDLSSLPGCFLINPTVYPKLELPRLGMHVRVVAATNDLVIVRTDGLVLGTFQNQIDVTSIPFEVELPKVINLSTTPNTAFAVIPQYVESLAVNLRQTSRQVDLSRKFVGIAQFERTELPKPDFPKMAAQSECLLAKYIWDTAITWEQLVLADSEIVNKAIPIHEKLILDAIHALRDRDHRRAILYSAISIESLAATRLNEIYVAATQHPNASSNLRIISRPQANGAMLARDPVFEFLFEKSKFAERLHEVSLYLTGKSLLVDNEPLYQQALKLYRTRNKIAHLGEPPTRESYFEMEENDAIIAIECALEIFQWFGEQNDFPLPKLGFVKLHAPMEEII